MRMQQTINTPRKPRIGAAPARVARRGNTLVLAAGILVLLVIIATSYLATTQTQRNTSVAQQAAAQRDDNSEVIGEMLAQELVDALFVWPVDWDDPALWDNNGDMTGVADANFPRKRPAPDARRYGIDWDFPYNFAPYHTVPFTNWPDWVFHMPWDDQYNPRWLPAGPGNLYYRNDGVRAGDGGPAIDSGVGNATIAALLSAEYNPLGNPGFGDNRWLRDTEPVRWDTGQFTGGFTPDELDAFSHWRKLTNIARANNGWRIVWDISDVDNHIMSDLNVPVEQWLNARPRINANPNNPAPFVASTGNVNSNFLFGGNPANPNSLFWRQWWAWFEYVDSPFDQGYADAFVNQPPLGAPPNLYKLNDLNGNGVVHDFSLGDVRQDTPEAEFIRGTARHTVSRVLTDTTGDGFTDSFWFLSPTPARGGIRQVVAVSIVDNSARLNANVATRFWPNNPFGADWHHRKTRSHTPADLALVGQMNGNPPVNGGHWNVGLYDNPDNWASTNVNDGVNFDADYRWTSANALRWQRHLYETGLPFEGWNVTPQNQPLSAFDRLDYWQHVGRMALGYHPQSNYRPFGLSDELELRMFEGNNHPWVYSRFEYTTQQDAPMTSGSVGLLRASPLTNKESSEYLDQLNNRELVRDLRRKLTLYSGARNDQPEPGLWWFNRYSIEPTFVQELAENPQDGVNPDVWRTRVYNNFAAQSRQKLDLREPGDWFHMYRPADGLPWYNPPSMGSPARWYDVADAGRLNLRDRLAPALLMALTDGPDVLEPGVHYGSYFGNYWAPGPFEPNEQFREREGPLNWTRRLAAAYAANILAYRSNQPVTLADAVWLPAFGYPGNVNRPSDVEVNYIKEGELPGETGDVAFLPIDPQPFLLEVFIGHVYKPTGETVPTYHVPEDVAAELDAEGYEWSCDEIPPEVLEQYEDIVSYGNTGQTVVLDDPETRSTIAAVQIVNPFDVPIDLNQYRITLFGQELEINALALPEAKRWLPPATDNHPVTAIFYTMRGSISDITGTNVDTLHADDKWLAFLDIVTSDGIVDGVAGPDNALVEGTIVVRVDHAIWPNETREAYDNRDNRNQALLLSRNFSPGAATPEWVVVDRIDDPNEPEGFGRAVNEMEDYKPVPRKDPICTIEPVLGPDNEQNYFPTYNIGQDEHWIQWVRATRAWGVDVNLNGLYENHERNPRFVFGDRAVIVPTELGTPERSDGRRSFMPRRRAANDGDTGDVDESSLRPGGHRYRFDDEPNDDPDDPRDPWFARTYYTADGILVDGTNPSDGIGVVPIRPRKPTFFAMNWREPRNLGAGQGRYCGDPGWSAGVRTYPDKGWYGQFAVDLAGLQTDEFNVRGIGWVSNNSGAGSSAQRVSGVDHPTVIYGGMAFLDENQTLNWTGPVTPLFRHPFAMQMAQKNKVFPYWEWLEDHTGFTNAQIDEIRRNRDFEQIGELLNVWLFGHEIVLDGVGDYQTTRTTFAEFMSAANADLTGLPATFQDYDDYERWLLDGQAHRVNRLHIKPVERLDENGDVEVVLGHVLNQPDPDLFANPWEYRRQARHAWPAVPAGARVLDLFVCDGAGRVWRDASGNPYSPEELDIDRFFNANGFTGRMTPGLININTATREVMRAMPHMTRIVPEWGPADYPFTEHPYPLVTEAIVRYRDRVGAPVEPTAANQLPDDEGPPYAHRGRQQGFFAFNGDNLNSKLVPGMRGDRGFASLGELSLLTQSGRREKITVAGGGSDMFFYENLSNQPLDGFLEIDWNSSWRMDYPTMPDRRYYQLDQPEADTPFAYLFRSSDVPPYAPNWVSWVPWSAHLSTATSNLFMPGENSDGYPVAMHPDITAEDLHEANVLLAGISNVVTTRSDTFTVHFRVRSFRQNPVTGVWDATDPEYIVDDTRYVMLVDRSNVNKPSDKPKILFLEKLPK